MATVFRFLISFRLVSFGFLLISFCNLQVRISLGYWVKDIKLSFNKVVYFLFSMEPHCCPQRLFTIHNQSFENNQVLRIVWDWFCFMIVTPLIERFKGTCFGIYAFVKGSKMRLHTGLYLVMLETFSFFILVLNERFSNVCTFISDT